MAVATKEGSYKADVQSIGINTNESTGQVEVQIQLQLADIFDVNPDDPEGPKVWLDCRAWGHEIRAYLHLYKMVEKNGVKTLGPINATKMQQLDDAFDYNWFPHVDKLRANMPPRFQVQVRLRVKPAQGQYAERMEVAWLSHRDSEPGGGSVASIEGEALTSVSQSLAMQLQNLGPDVRAKRRPAPVAPASTPPAHLSDAPPPQPPVAPPEDGLPY